jgi:hydrogenase maturation protease
MAVAPASSCGRNGERFMRTLVLGLGNPILSDDAVGLHVASAVSERLGPDSAIEVDTDCWGGLRLMERLVGYERAVIIDAICTGDYPAGTVLLLGVDDVPTEHSGSAHDVNLPTALKLAATMGLVMPQQITIIAVAAQNVLELGEALSPAVAAAVPAAVERVLASITGKEEFGAIPVERLTTSLPVAHSGN